MNKLYLRLLVAILHLLMDIKEGQSSSRYSWEKEKKLLRETQEEINK
jgi:hypothetical protein